MEDRERALCKAIQASRLAWLTLYATLKNIEADRISDGYISFPDFEQFCHNQNAYDQHHGNTAVKT
jgi:hypothetical protein